MVEESMRFFTSMWDGGIRRGALALAAVLLATAAPAETLRVTAANSVGNLVYDVTSFVPPGTISALNTDGASHGSFSSIVLAPNLTTGTVDVLAADFTKGQIIRYTPALGATAASTTLVWSYNGSGPINPDGLSQDAAGNLYIVSSKPPQIWVLPASSTSSTGFASAPLLIQGTFAGGAGVVQLQETAVAATAGPAWGAGDVLLLVGNKNSTSNQNTNNDDLYLYRAATITRILGGAGPVSAPDQVLISGMQFPNREYGLGMDFWPGDSFDPNPTLLVLTTAGRILRYDFTAHNPSLVQVFASGLGGGVAKLKVGLQLENRYAYVTQTLSGNTGQILQFGAPTSPGTTNLVGSASQGVHSPDGLAVEPLGTATAASCATPIGCDISSGVIPHKLVVTPGSTTPTGNVIESTCVVLKDPRVVSGQCDGTSLNVSTLCPGFGNEIIPGTLCGASGVSQAGFALVRTNATGVNNIPGILVTSESNVDKILPPALNAPLPNPACPSNTYSWAPFSDASPSEGSIVNVDPATGYSQLTELTSFCGTSGGSNRGMSIYGVGLVLNVPALNGGYIGDANQKLTDLSSTVATANINDTTPPPPALTVKKAVQACLSNIGSYMTQADYSCAASETVQCDALVGTDSNPAGNYPGNAANPNPWGEIRGRLGNLYVALNSRVLNNQPPNHSWPPGGGDVVPTCASPSLTLTATPATTPPGGQVRLTWVSQHLAACTASGGWAGAQPVNNPGPGVAVTPATTTTYNLDCTGAGGPKSASVTVSVPPTIVSFTAVPATVPYNTPAQLIWTVSNAQSCSVQGLGVSGTATSGIYTPNLTASSTYVLTCTNGVTSSASVTVGVVPLPTVTLTANPTTIPEERNNGSTLTWSSTNATSCTASGAWSGSKPLSGTASTGRILSTKTYILTCAGPGGSASAHATVTFTDDD
jgi:hypothetical protein